MDFLARLALYYFCPDPGYGRCFVFLNQERAPVRTVRVSSYSIMQGHDSVAWLNKLG